MFFSYFKTKLHPIAVAPTCPLPSLPWITPPNHECLSLLFPTLNPFLSSFLFGICLIIFVPILSKVTKMFTTVKGKVLFKTHVIRPVCFCCATLHTFMVGQAWLTGIRAREWKQAQSLYCRSSRSDGESQTRNREGEIFSRGENKGRSSSLCQDKRASGRRCNQNRDTQDQQGLFLGEVLWQMQRPYGCLKHGTLPHQVLLSCSSLLV